MTRELLELQRAAQDCGEPGICKGACLVVLGWLTVGCAVLCLHVLVQPVWESFQ